MSATAEGRLLREVRTDARLSQRALARRAVVPATTVVRIEKGDVEPTTRTLRTLLAAVGRELALGASAADIPLLASLSDAWEHDPSGEPQPDWTRIRAYLDHLSQNPDLRGPSTLPAPRPSGVPLIDNLLAAIAEKLSDEAGLDRPAWTRAVPRLAHDWLPDGTPTMVRRERATTPEQFARRGIWLGENNLWRRRASARGSS